VKEFDPDFLSELFPYLSVIALATADPCLSVESVVKLIGGTVEFRVIGAAA
jgi:hypothetical protein